MAGNLEQCPPPGTYPGVSFEDYIKWNAINHSKLQRIDKSPLHAKTPVDLSASKAIKLGQLVHCGQLEFDSIIQRYRVMPDYHLTPENVTVKGVSTDSKSTTFYKERSAWFFAECVKLNKTVVTVEEFAKLDACLMAILKSKEACDCLSGGNAELSIVWRDDKTGLLCKARIDYQKPDRLTDLKTSRDDKSTPLTESFDWSLWTYAYFSQAAWYQEGWRNLTGDLLPFYFAVVTNSEPFQAIAAPVGEMSLRVGRRKNAERLDKWLACEQAGKWPGYASPVMFELPDKYLSDNDEEIADDVTAEEAF